MDPHGLTPDEVWVMIELLYDKNSPIRKSALVLLMLGEDVAKNVLLHLSEDEIRKLGRAASQMQDVSPQEIVDAMQEFSELFRGEQVPKGGAEALFQGLAERALGPERAKALLHINDDDEEPFTLLERLPVSRAANLLAQEHPQTIALVLTQLTPASGAAIISKLPEERRSEIMARMASLGSVSSDILRELGTSLRESLRELGAQPEASNDDAPVLDQQARVVEILKGMDDDLSNNLLEDLAMRDPELAAELRSKLFVFEDLQRLDARSLQRLLREVDTRRLSVALRGAPENVQEAFFAAMSSRAADMLREDMESGGMVRLADVEAAQKEIVEVALRLEREGTLVLPRGGADLV